MSDLQPRYRHVFRLAEGGELRCLDRDARRTIDRRGESAPNETVWEVTLPSGIVRRLWPTDILDWSIEDIT